LPTLQPFGSLTRALKHDPEKCEAVFRKNHAQIKKLKRDDHSSQSHRALASAEHVDRDHGRKPEQEGPEAEGRDHQEIARSLHARGSRQRWRITIHCFPLPFIF
jgi:hypothetical protein